MADQPADPIVLSEHVAANPEPWARRAPSPRCDAYEREERGVKMWVQESTEGRWMWGASRYHLINSTVGSVADTREQAQALALAAVDIVLAAEAAVLACQKAAKS